MGRRRSKYIQFSGTIAKQEERKDKARGKKRGVAIILSPNYAKAWKSAGGLEPITTAKGEFEGRFTGLLLQFSCINNTDTGKIVKGKHLRILLASAYHPWSEDDDSCMTC